ncbi:SEC14 family lipid-binding protein [Sporobolomyces salmoneus]|uniref:SEC14 family lipid-binding protein n=1 Tax=Sporobolomyces salmoneus TaxID=183962 RepID=UPI00317C6D00
MSDTPKETTEVGSLCLERSATLKPISSRQLEGHIGHLTPEQDATLSNFRQKLEKAGYYSPAEGSKPANVDDVTLVRFLRARKFDLEGAFTQFTSAEDWRKANKVDELYDSFDLSEFNQAARLYPQWTGRRDKSGLPVYVFKISSLSKKATDEYVKDPERLNPRMIALYEHMVQFVLPLCSSVPHAHSEVPVSGCATIVDISGVSLMRFWQLKSHMQRASVLASANYAETLGAIYLVGAPNFFSTVWAAIKKWFDPGTVEKIFILPSHGVLSTLSTHIDPSSIPKEFGGSLDWTYGDDSRPNLDDDTKEMLGLNEVPEGPLRWFGKERGCELRGTGRDRKVEEEIEEKLESRKNSRMNTPQREEEEEGASPTTTRKETETVAREEPKSVADSVPTTTQTITTQEVAPTPATTTTPIDVTPVDVVPQVEETGLPPPIGMANLNLGASKPTTTPTSTETTREGDEHNIHVAARENPSAPLKDLAATLEGTTL